MLYSCIHMGTVGVKGLSAFAINCWSVWNGLGRESGATKIRKSASARYIYMTVSWASSRQQTMMRPKSVVFWNWAILVGLYLRRRCYCVYTDFDLALQLNFHCIPLSLSLSPSVCLSLCVCSLVRYQLWGCHVLFFVHYGGRRCVCRLLCPEKLK